MVSLLFYQPKTPLVWGVNFVLMKKTNTFTGTNPSFPHQCFPAFPYVFVGKSLEKKNGCGGLCGGGWFQISKRLGCPQSGTDGGIEPSIRKGQKPGVWHTGVNS